MTLTVPARAGLSRIALDGKAIAAGNSTRPLLINCASPGCRAATVTFTQKRVTPFTLQLTELRYGLPPGGEAFRKARGPLGTPSQLGDGIELITKLRSD